MSPTSTTTSSASRSVRGRDFRELAEEQVALFDRDMAAIGLAPVDAAPRATAHVPEMVDWVTRLVERGYAYAVDGWVFFDSGVVSGLRTAQPPRPGDDDPAQSRERGADPDDPRKRHPLDFVLWQAVNARRAELAEPLG